MAGTHASREPQTDPVLGRLEVVLVRPQLPENIGAAARAMRNCGLSRLCLVSPRDGWQPTTPPNPTSDAAGDAAGAPRRAPAAASAPTAPPAADPKRLRHPVLRPDQVYARACAVASGAEPLLADARVVESVEEALAPHQRVLATTARPRELRTPVLDPEQAAAQVVDALAAEQSVALVFGPERTGLETDDLQLADAFVTVPLNPGFSSLNLGQAVLLVSHAVWRARLARPGRAGDDPGFGSGAHPPSADHPDPPAPKAAVDRLLRHLAQELDAAAFAKSPTKREALYRTVQNVFARARLSRREVSLLHGVVTALSGRRLGGRRRGAPRAREREHDATEK